MLTLERLLRLRGRRVIAGTTPSSRKNFTLNMCRGKFKVAYVLDDRPRVVRMWRAELGLTVFQVAPNIEF